MAKSHPSSGTLRRAGPHRAAHPVAAGFRPAAAALAVAVAFTAYGAPAGAQPVPQAVIHGGATFTQNGSNLLVNTTNGANTSHSAINWTSFSVPAGSVTQFVQPSAASTSINRVVAPNPSEIFGRLASNGRLVLVNPSGIAVGLGAQVDTAGFTASTLAMSETDAIAGRLRFAGGGSLLKVDGTIRAQGGDVVLIAPKVETGAAAVVETDGAAVLAAGQQVEITGRGLEGIHLKVQAGSEAVNLGSLKADAVGMFAGTLRHSGLVQAQAVSAEGGKVVLKATGDVLVDGAVSARKGDRGGAVDVLGERVGLLAGARIDASGAAGGGNVRVGGDYQGGNAEVPNARRTYLDAQASINADATQSGDGGRVIVWSEEATRMHGRISARGGEQGGDGGFAEVSGKQYLEFTGRADLRAPQGRTGTLLLDPNDIEIVSGGTTTTSDGTDGIFQGGGETAYILDSQLSAQLGSANVLVTTNGSDFTGPHGGRITLQPDATVAWSSGNALHLNAYSGIELGGAVDASGAGSLLQLYSQTGAIRQLPGSTITVDKLLAQGTGSVLLEQPGNRVNTLAGYAGEGSTFAFKNAQDLTVGSITPPAGWTLDGVNAWNSGPTTRIATTAGSLTVRQPVGGRGISLSAAEDISVQNTYVHSGGPSTDPSATLDLVAGRDVRIGSEPTEYSYTHLHGSAGTSIRAGRDFLAGALNSDVYINGDGSGVTVLAGTGDADFGTYTWVGSYGGSIEVRAKRHILGSGNFSTWGSSAGTVVLEASTGSLGFGGIYSSGSYSAPRGGNVTLTAAGDVSGGSIHANGSSTSPEFPDGAGGEVRVTSTGGNIFIYGIDADGGYGNSTDAGPGGKILLSAPGTAAGAGSIFIGGSLRASGGDGGYAYYGDESHGFAGGNGGWIELTAHKNIDSMGGRVEAFGGDGSSGSLGSAPGGRGGKVYMTALTGNIALATTAVDVHGGAGQAAPSDGLSGRGGLIDLKAPQGSFSGSQLDARGGWGYSGTGGGGGSISVLAGQDLTLTWTSPPYFYDYGYSYEYPYEYSYEYSYGGVSADGGGSSSSPDGTGGVGGYVSLSSTGGSLTVGGNVTSRGGNAYRGGGGGVILLEAANGIHVPLVDASGSNSRGNDSIPGGTGGDGGFIDVLVGGALDVPMLHARGGDGGPLGETTPGGDGGWGGGISVTFAGASGTLDLGMIDASGGRGGSVPTWMSVDPGLPPGAGGGGGAIAIGGAGNLRVGGMDTPLQLHARGGDGGSGFGFGGNGPAGPVGHIEIAGGNVVLDNLYLYGNSVVAATGGVATSAGSWQYALSGEGIAVEAGTGITLAGSLLAYGTMGFGGVGLHTTGGNITQTGGSITTGGVLARADAGNVGLAQANSFWFLAGAAGGTFDAVSSTDFLEIGSISHPFASATGIQAAGGASVRSRGTLHVAAGVSSSAGSVVLRAGDATIPGGVYSAGAGAGGSLHVLAPVAAAGSLTLEGSGTIDAGVEVASTSLMAGNALVLRGTTSSGPGVELSDASLHGGTIDVLGRSSASDAPGVLLVGQNHIVSGSGATITGEHLAGTGFAPGVLVGELECTTSACVLAGTGALRLVGTSNGPGAGVMVERATIDRTGGLELLGSSASGMVGVRVGSSNIRTGGGNALFVSPQTVLFDASTVDTAGGGLGVTGGSATHDAAGVIVTGGSSLHAATGAVAIMGVSELSPGFELSNTSGGPGATVSGGEVEIVGSTVQNGEALVIDNETVSATHSLRLLAQGGALVVRNGSTITNTGPGPLVMNSTAGPGGPSLVRIEAGNTVTASGGGDINILADNAQVDGTVDSGSGRTLIRPLDTTRRILINGADDSLGLNFTQAELDRITGAMLVIGDAALSGGISIEAPTTTNGRSLSLINAGAIQQQSGATLTVGHLHADGARVVLEDVLIGGTAGGILSGRSHAGEFRIVNRNAAPLQVGTVDGIHGVEATGGPVTIHTAGPLQLSQPVRSDAAGNAITLVASELGRDGAGELAAPNGRWLVYLDQPTPTLAGSPLSGNLALWGRPFLANAPTGVTEAGNRYLFAVQPVVHVAADNVSRGYDGTTNFGPFGFSVAGLVDAAEFGNVFLQDSLTGSLVAPGATRHAGSYAISTDGLVEPVGYARGSFQPGTLTITPATLTVNAQPDTRQYDGTDGSSALPPQVTLFGTDIGRFTQRFDTRHVGTGKTLTPQGVVDDGNGGNNYAVTFVSLPVGEITPAPLVVTAVADTRVYDGTDASDGVPVLTGTLYGSDTGSFSQRFADRNAGSGKTLVPQGTVGDGNGGGNYVVSLTPVTTGVIRPKPLTITADNLNKAEGVELVFAGTEFHPKTTGVGAETVTTVSLASEGAAAGARSGAYPIVPGNAVGSNGFVAGNYDITYLNGALAVFLAAPEPAAVIQTNNQVLTFATLFLEQAKTQPSIQADEDWKKNKDDRSKDDIVVTDTACTP